MTNQKINRIREIKLNKKGKLKVGKIMYKLKDKGMSYLQEVSKKIGVNFYTMRDWIQAYEATKDYPSNANLSLTCLKKLTRKKNKEKESIYIPKKNIESFSDPIIPKKRKHKSKAQQFIKKEFFSLLYDVYNKLKTLKNTPENSIKVNKINFIAGLIRAEVNLFKIKEEQLEEYIQTDNPSLEDKIAPIEYDDSDLEPLFKSKSIQ